MIENICITYKLFLISLYRQDPDWTKATITQLSEILDIKSIQIYKWGYHRKHKALGVEKKALKRESKKVRDHFFIDLLSAYLDLIYDFKYLNLN
jgi:mevalonate kinase